MEFENKRKLILIRLPIYVYILCHIFKGLHIISRHQYRILTQSVKQQLLYVQIVLTYIINVKRELLDTFPHTNFVISKFWNNSKRIEYKDLL